MSRTKRLIALALLSMTLGAAPAYDPDRLGPREMEALVAQPLELVRQGSQEQGEQALEQLIAAEKAPLRKADLIESFGVELYILGAEKREKEPQQRAVIYLERAVQAYKSALGSDDPEVATALSSLGDLLRVMEPDNPPRSVDAAYEEAYRIRLARLGSTSFITQASRVPIAVLQALPSRAHGDRSALLKAKATLQEVYDVCISSQDPLARRVLGEVDMALTALGREYGQPVEITRKHDSGQPSSVLFSGPLPNCPEAVVIFFGDEASMKKLKQAAEKRSLYLQPCDNGLVLPSLGPETSEGAVALMQEIVAGRYGKIAMGMAEPHRPSSSH